MVTRSLTSLIVLASFWLGVFAPFIHGQVPAGSTPAPPPGLQFNLRELAGPATAPAAIPPPVIEKLSDREANEIFGRLPRLLEDPSDELGFRLRSDSLKRPRPGNVVSIKFPADTGGSEPVRTPVALRPLEVTRHSPNGNVPIVSDLSTTFSQPMVAVTTQSAASASVPVVLSPAVKGQWRWLGTQTLIFDAETRFPMATRFTATVPHGTVSSLGGVLAKDVSWSFTTPAPKVEIFVPRADGQTVEPQSAIMAAKFDQAIDEKEVIKKITVTAGGRRIEVVSATAEIEPNHTVYQQLGEVKPGQWMAFRTIEMLPLDAEVKVVFEKGTPSAEGDLVTEKDQAFSFRTIAPLKFEKSFCGYNETNSECEPSNDLTLKFNNPLFPVQVEAGQVTVEPAIENVKVITQNNLIFIQGKKTPNTAYTVSVAGSIRDYYKQPLGQGISAVFNVGTERPQFAAPGGDFVTLDPFARPTFSVYSKNQPSLKVRVYAVTPDDYLKFRPLLQNYYNSRDTVPNPTFGRLVIDKTVEIASAPDQLIETRIDLTEVMPNLYGHAVLVVEPALRDKRYYYECLPSLTWLQSTGMGIDAALDYEKMSAYVSDLKTGKPLGGIDISLHNDKYNVINTVTNAAGVGDFLLADTSGRGFLLAKNGNDTAILRESNDYQSDYTDWRKKAPYSASRWHVFDDRKMYRPGEEVSVKGYIRTVTGGTTSDIAEIDGEEKAVNYKLKDTRGNEIKKGTVTLNAFGAFDLKLALPENINLGYERLELWRGEYTDYPAYTHNFQVQEFRRPEFEEVIAAQTPAPYFVGTSAAFTAEAKYYTGGPLANTAMNWRLSARQTNYTPPNRDGFVFGTFIPWWGEYSSEWTGLASNGGPTEDLGGTTDADGKHRIGVDFVSANPSRPFMLSVSAETQDVNRQSIADTKQFLVHPSDVYVGIRTPKTFVRKGEMLSVEAVATDLDGKTVLNAPITVEAVLRDWQSVGNTWQLVTLDTQTCSRTSAEPLVACEFNASHGGTFTFTATVLDRRERPNSSELTAWVAGGQTPPKREVEQEKADLIPDKKDYSPGDVAEVLVNSPIVPAEGVMTLERNGIVRSERFTMSEGSTILRVPIEERYLPNVRIKVDLTGVSARTDDAGAKNTKMPYRPSFASGEINLNVSKTSRKLTVSVDPAKKTIEPGGKTKVDVNVRDAGGNAVANSEVTLVAVDESVLALTGYRIDDPLDAFYQQLNGNVTHYHTREKVVLANPDSEISSRQFQNFSVDGVNASQVMEMVNVTDSAISSRSLLSLKPGYKNWKQQDVAYIISGDKKPKINVRKNFAALAIFAPSVVTDANGRASVDLKLPDSLTRYRITAVAVTKTKFFGSGESSVTAKQSLQARPSAPRFLNFGDRAELPVVLQNQTDTPMTVNVAIRGTNALLTDGNGRKVTVPGNDRVEVRFPISTLKAGTARFQIGAVSGSNTDAAQIEIPVYTPATTEAFATYGTTDANGAIVQPIFAPKDVYPDFGGLEISTSSTQLQQLTDAYIYLDTYPFDCTEQVSSRVLAVTALRDVLKAFDAKGIPDRAEIDQKMLADILRLKTLQHYDGGWSFWKVDDDSFPYVSVHVAHALARAKLKGYQIPDEVVEKSMSYLKQIESKYPKTYSQESRWAISAYAIYVRDLFGEHDADKARRLVKEATVDALSAETLGWLMSVLAADPGPELDAIKQNLLNRVTETAGNAHFVTNYTDGEYVLLSSDRRADGIILEALLKTEPDNTLIPKIVRDLLANRLKGRWRSTQENAFVLLALDKYFETYEKTTPNFVARVWLGSAYAGEQRFTGRSADTNSIAVPMSYLQAQTVSPDLTLDKQGAGRLYYRVGMNYAPRDLKLKAADYGFVVSRAYEAIDDEADVRQNADGSWLIRAGSRVRVRITMVAPTRRYHVALVDSLPAGLEILNPELKISAVDYVPDTTEMRYRSYWFEHQNLRDNRAEAFTSLLLEGKWNYSYIARATTPGLFLVPPARAEEMYAPETFGRGKTDTVQIR